jgi:capsular polysaccharide biosynthesis protein
MLRRLYTSASHWLTRKIRQTAGKQLLRRTHTNVMSSAWVRNDPERWHLRFTGEPETITIPAPVTVAPIEGIPTGPIGTWTLDPPWVLTASDAIVCAPLGTLYTSDGAVIAESHATEAYNTGWEVPISTQLSHRRATSAATIRTLARAAPFAGYWSDNYFHWLIEGLPRIGLLPPDVPLIVPERLTRWQRASLDLLGVDADRLIGVDGAPFRVREAFVASYARGRTPGQRFVPVRPSMARWLRERLRVADGSGPQRVYITRNPDAGRAAANEGEVRAALEGAGFTTCDPAAMPLRDQVELFSGAKLIVGLHGAGLANAVFATDAAVIEVLGRPRTLDYLYVCAAVGHRYGALQCTETRAIHPSQRNLIVDVPALLRLVDVILTA